ncbi:MAG: hypothetical protein ACRDO8_05065 [Nocardioidaceae bacterium]
MSTTASSGRPLLDALIDDAAMFPPGNAPVAEAVRAHAQHRASAHAALVGPLLCSDKNLAALDGVVDGPLDLAVVVTGGAGAIGPAITHAGRTDGVRVVGVEIALRDEDDLSRNAQRIATMLDLELPENAVASVEMPRLGDGPPTGSWFDAADEVAAAGHRLKFRTGGEWADSHPDEPELATFVSAALDRECAFKLTAGLHRAIRHSDAGTGFERHGFLNVLLATRVLLDGGHPTDATYALVRRDTEGIVAELGAWDDARAASARRWFTSFGSCSIDEPLTDLTDLEMYP